MDKKEYMELPVAIEVHPKAAQKYIKVELKGDDRKKLEDLTVSGAVEYVVNNYLPRSSLNTKTKEEIQGIIEADPLHYFDVFGHMLVPNLGTDGEIGTDPRKEKVRDYLRKSIDEDNNPFLDIIIHVYTPGSESLGGLETRIKRT